MSLGLNPTFLTRMLKDLWQISTFRSWSVAWPCSSKAITTTAAPYLLINFALDTKSFSPSFKEMELTMLLPWQHLRPASKTEKSEESYGKTRQIRTCSRTAHKVLSLLKFVLYYLLTAEHIFYLSCYNIMAPKLFWVAGVRKSGSIWTKYWTSHMLW